MMEDLKPETTYFQAVDGDRVAFLSSTCRTHRRSSISPSGCSLA
jgi:hypothetical protein